MGTTQGVITGERLVIQLEDAATRSRWAWLLGLMVMHQMWHFVGLVGGQKKYDSPTFAAPYSWGTVPMGKTGYPREQWAPGMSEALDALCAEIAADGWTEVACGPHPWEHVYRRAADQARTK